MNRFQWGPKSIAELKAGTARGDTFQVIAAQIGCEPRTAQRMQTELGLRKPFVRKPWSKTERAVLVQRYPHISTKMLAAQLGRGMGQVYQQAAKMGLSKSEAYLESPDACRLRRGDQVGKQFRYPPGHVPANLGLRRPGWSPGRMAVTQFKPGERSGKAAENWMPIGTIRADADGYLRLKLREHRPGERNGFGNTDIWPLLHRHRWEEAHGPIPPGHAVVFKTKDRSNVGLENLELITRGELMRRNTIHNYPPELKRTIMYLGAVKRKVRENAEKLNDRPAQPSL